MKGKNRKKGSEWNPAPQFPKLNFQGRTLFWLVAALFLSVAFGALAVGYMLHHMFDK